MAESRCTLTVEFDIAADRFGDFLTLVQENAVLSVRDEPGCLRFDVLVPLTREKSVLLYEIYRSRHDFERHLAADHYCRFDAATQGMVLAKTVTFHRLTENAKSA